MMERVKPEWIWLGLAFVIICVVPWFLLSADDDDVEKLEPVLTTQVQMQDIAVVDMLLTKPLFNSGRKVIVPGLPDTEAPADGAQGQSQMTPAPTLVGLVSKRRGKAVAIIKTHDGETKTLARGQSSDGWKLVSVRKNAAVFANAGENKTIGLNYSNKAVGGPGVGDAIPASEPEPGIDIGENE
ncbi:hypothetical protein SAMN02745824_3345 [Parasphingorhabdus marina DSM 22363]|uniref:Uncharacterized protein n=1 Tax=Parasphingorhabdus marina DSM 22363 TaxID=1123272 RepID=A0A1N6HLC0_9SPHN|nr:hypothetical protein [Parasphingorhabdus marina]SIO20553.1 hypothetical protein SAMN02745824_3345 [Parasphingorhabdus marina DSM 22363]